MRPSSLHVPSPSSSSALISAQHARRWAAHAIPPRRPDARPESPAPSSPAPAHHPPAPSQRAGSRLRTPARRPRPLRARLWARHRARRAGVVGGRARGGRGRSSGLLQLPHQLRVLRLQCVQLGLDLRSFSRSLPSARAERLQQARLGGRAPPRQQRAAQLQQRVGRADGHVACAGGGEGGGAGRQQERVSPPRLLHAQQTHTPTTTHHQTSARTLPRLRKAPQRAASWQPGRQHLHKLPTPATSKRCVDG